MRGAPPRSGPSDGNVGAFACRQESSPLERLPWFPPDGRGVVAELAPRAVCADSSVAPAPSSPGSLTLCITALVTFSNGDGQILF